MIRRNMFVLPLICTGFPVLAESYPARAVKVVVPYPAGGTLDALARAIVHALQSQANFPAIVENKSGANGIIGTEAVANATADGYTLLFNSSAMQINEVIYSKIKYKTLRDFVPISESVYLAENLLLVHQQSTYKSMQELLAAAKASPRTVTYGSPGVGNGQQILMESIAQQAGLKLHHIPYRGIPDMLNALLRQEIDMIFLNPLLAEPHLQASKIRALATVANDGSKRAKRLPDVPAMAEVLSGFHWSPTRFGFYAATQTPVERIASVQKALASALDNGELRRYLADGGFEPVGGNSQQFRTGIEADLVRYAKVAAAAGISLERN
ncbi:tripartite tricarboxylate transporter substrate binding protein [Variovorax sp. KK3]|uniref:Bug family tripartite tricarboxylate transporter substrate binding protein n=1 Tax=Variovorax sp. KK3 TaxID=1855728 RepID=UPI0015C2D57A|nr:tripartite tricarboxylate transporter substrate binding protein [Variovorax sp. KK3]